MLLSNTSRFIIRNNLYVFPFSTAKQINAAFPDLVTWNPTVSLNFGSVPESWRRCGRIENQQLPMLHVLTPYDTCIVQEKCKKIYNLTLVLLQEILFFMPPLVSFLFNILSFRFFLKKKKSLHRTYTLLIQYQYADQILFSNSSSKSPNALNSFIIISEIIQHYYCFWSN